MWEWISTNANPIMAVTAILALAGGFVGWLMGLWGSRNPARKTTAKSGGVIVEGDVKGNVTTNPSRKRKK